MDSPHKLSTAQFKFSSNFLQFALRAILNRHTRSNRHRLLWHIDLIDNENCHSLDESYRYRYDRIISSSQNFSISLLSFDTNFFEYNIFDDHKNDLFFFNIYCVILQSRINILSFFIANINCIATFSLFSLFFC